MGMIQCQFINKIIDSHDVTLLNGLSEDFFSDYTEEYQYIVDHINQYKCTPDPASFIAKFPDFIFLDVHDSIDYLYDELYKDKNKRALATVFQSIRDLVNTNKIDEAIDVYTKSLGITSERRVTHVTDLFRDTERYNSYIERCNNYEQYYVSTGFKELDQIVGGWDRTEDLVTIVARPGVGKTYIMLRSAVTAAENGLNVGIYSGEMSAQKIGYRVDTLISHISNTGISKGNSYFHNTYKAYIEDLPNKFKGSIKVLTPIDLGDYATIENLKEFIEHEKLDILFVDQYSLLKDTSKSKSPSEQVAALSKGMKNLQVLKKIPIITVSQQNRTSTEETGVSVSNIAQSDRIGQDSTIVLFLEPKDDILKVHLVKSRESSTGKSISYAVDFDKGIFQYIPSEQDALSGVAAEDLKAEFDKFEDDEEDVF